MGSQTPERVEYVRTYDDRWSMISALLVALLIGVGVVGLFMFITWFAYASS